MNENIKAYTTIIIIIMLILRGCESKALQLKKIYGTVNLRVRLEHFISFDSDLM